MERGLTILLTLKGREEFNQRWISYHETAGLPWDVYVADGAPTDDNEALFGRSALKCKYLRYNDVDIRAYIRKLADALQKVATPYVMLVDNDDFIFPHGVERAVQSLHRRADYVSSGGLVAGLHLGSRNLTGVSVVRGAAWYGLKTLYHPVRIDQALAHDRVLSLIADYVPTWYCVHRTDAARRAFDEIVRAKIGDLLLFEQFFVFAMAAQGKVDQKDSALTYLRQLNSSQTRGLYGSTEERLSKGTLRNESIEMARSLASMIRPDYQSELTDKLQAAFVASITSRDAAPRYSSVQHFLRRYIHTARAKVPAVQQMMQFYEMAQVKKRMTPESAAAFDAAFHQVEFCSVG